MNIKIFDLTYSHSNNTQWRKLHKLKLKVKYYFYITSL